MRNDGASTVDIICLSNRHQFGGAPLNAGLLAAEFASRGYRAEVGFLFELEPEARHGPAPFFVVANQEPRTAVEWRRFLADFRREILDRRPRAIIGFQSMANVLGALAAHRIPGCRMIASQRIPADRQRASAGYVERLVGSTRLYDANIAVSEAVATSFDRYPASYKRKLQVVLNATPPLVEVSDDRASCRARFGMPDDRQVLGCVGRLHPQKNVSFALDVLAGLPNAVLFLAGGGEEEAELRAKAEVLGVAERVTFLGALDGADITRFYRALDALLFPSIYEGFGRTLVEAMSQGVPVVASDIPIVREVGGEALLPRRFEVSAWVEAIEAIGSDPVLAGHLRDSGIERATAFELPKMVDGYLTAAGLTGPPGHKPADS